MLQVVVAAVTALGHLASSAPNAAQLSAVTDGLFGLAAHKAEEVQFAVGEALCFVFGGAAPLVAAHGIVVCTGAAVKLCNISGNSRGVSDTLEDLLPVSGAVRVCLKE